MAPNGGSPHATITSCIFWENADNNFSGPRLDESAQINVETGSTATVTSSCIQGLIPGGGFDNGSNISEDPLFVDANGVDNIAGNEDDDLRLLAGSPCIDTGNNSAVTESTDLDGNPRIVTCKVDMGAYENQTPCTTLDADGDGVCDDCDVCPGYDDAEPCPIPTVSQWGIIVMFLLTLTTGCIVIRKQPMGKT